MNYKLLIWYPSLPLDWEIGMEVGQGDRGSYGTYSPCNGKYTDLHISIESVKCNYFWEEYNPEFEVCELIGNRVDYKLNGYANDMLSVKRMSDGNVFSIGDSVINPRLHSNQWFTISGFTMDCFNEHLLVLGGNGGIGLRKIEHHKVPLFVTEDGVEIYKDDKYVILHTATNQICGVSCASTNVFPSDIFLNFSTRAKVQEYLVLNTRKYSIQEILNASLDVFYLNDNHKIVDLNKLKNNYEK